MLSISFVQCNKSIFCQEATIYLSEIIHVTIFFTAITFSYFLVYASFIGESPSLFLVWNIANSGKTGLSKNDLYKLIMESKGISSSIKERVNKIHEFQIYK